jgi:tripartite-type tricarboxylate transporter receptor subunit TctC
MTRLLIQTLLVLTSAIVPSFVSAQSTYPTKPVKIIVPFLAGCTTDIVGRLVAQELTKAGINAVVENRPGAGGNIGAEQAAKSQPDGYTLFVGTVGTHGINSSLYANTLRPDQRFRPYYLGSFCTQRINRSAFNASKFGERAHRLN